MPDIGHCHDTAITDAMEILITDTAGITGISLSTDPSQTVTLSLVTAKKQVTDR